MKEEGGEVRARPCTARCSQHACRPPAHVARGHFGISGGLSEGRCDRDMLACTHVPCTQRMSLPDTRNLVEVWARASRHRIYLVVCTVDLLLTLTNAYWVPSIITGLGTAVERVARHESGYANNLQIAHYNVNGNIVESARSSQRACTVHTTRFRFQPSDVIAIG